MISLALAVVFKDPLPSRLMSSFPLVSPSPGHKESCTTKRDIYKNISPFEMSFSAWPLFFALLRLRLMSQWWSVDKDKNKEPSASFAICLGNSWSFSSKYVPIIKTTQNNPAKVYGTLFQTLSQRRKMPLSPYSLFILKMVCKNNTHQFDVTLQVSTGCISFHWTCKIIMRGSFNDDSLPQSPWL